MTKRKEELGFSVMNTNSAKHDRIAGEGHHHNDSIMSLPVASASPFPHWNVSETSQYYSKEPAGGNSTIGSSQFRSSHDFRMEHNYSYEGDEHKSIPYRPDSGVSWPQGYTRHQYTGHDNVTIPDDVMNAGFNVNTFEKPESRGKCVIPSDSSASRPQMINPGGTEMNCIDQPLLNMNLGVPLFNPNQGGAEPLLSPGILDDRFMTVGSGSNRKSRFNVMPKFNPTGTSERVFLPPSNTLHNQHQLDSCSRSFLNPGLDINNASSVFQNDSVIIPDVANIGNQEVFLDSGPGLSLGPSYAFQRPASGDLSLGGVANINREFAGRGHKNGLGRCTALPSLPFVASQTMPSGSGQSRVNGPLVPSSIRMVTNMSPSKLLPKNNGKFSPQSFAGPPSVRAARSTRGQDPSSNHGQSQVVGSTQQSSSPFGPYSAHGTAQASMPSMIPSQKRAASQPLSSTVPDQRRRILPAQPFVHQSTPNWTTLAPSVANVPQSTPPLVHAAQSLRPVSPHPLTQPLFPTRTKSTLSGPNTTQPLPPSANTTLFPPSSDRRVSSFHPPSHTLPRSNKQQIAKSTLSGPNTTQPLPPSANTTLFPPSSDRRVSSFHPPSHTLPRSNKQQIAKTQSRQQIAQSRDRQHLRAPVIQSVPKFSPKYIKHKDQTQLEPFGYKCLLCKRDLYYEPEGPISQPLIPPAAAVLSCGHTFHLYCLERITPDDESKDPPCIPCALGE